MESQKTPVGSSVPAPHKGTHLACAGRAGSVCGSVSLHDLPRCSQLFTNTWLLEPGHGSGAGADLWWDCLGEESPVPLKLLRCLILKVSGICLHVLARSVLSWGVFAQ